MNSLIWCPTGQQTLAPGRSGSNAVACWGPGCSRGQQPPAGRAAPLPSLPPAACRLAAINRTCSWLLSLRRLRSWQDGMVSSPATAEGCQSNRSAPGAGLTAATRGQFADMTRFPWPVAESVSTHGSDFLTRGSTLQTKQRELRVRIRILGRKAFRLRK